MNFSGSIYLTQVLCLFAALSSIHSKKRHRGSRNFSSRRINFIRFRLKLNSYHNVKNYSPSIARTFALSWLWSFANIWITFSASILWMFLCIISRKIFRSACQRWILKEIRKAKATLYRYEINARILCLTKKKKYNKKEEKVISKTFGDLSRS